MELCYAPFTMSDGLRVGLEEPPATVLVLPNGWVKVAAALPHICADLRRQTLTEAWDSYRSAWRNDNVIAAVRDAIRDEASHAHATDWRTVSVVQD